MPFAREGPHDDGNAFGKISTPRGGRWHPRMKQVSPLTLQLNWNLLRTFFVIVEERSITRAAQRLSLSQPSVSLALQRLEEGLGVQLLERNSRSFVLTKNGEIVAGHCAEVFQSVNRLAERIVSDEDVTTGTVRLLIVSHLQSVLVDESIRLFHQRHPSVTWHMEVANSADIVRQVAQELTPFGICLLMKPAIGLDCRLLCREEFAIFCGQEHPLFGCTEVSVAELQQEPFVSFTCARDGVGFEPMTMLREGTGLGTRIVGASAHLEEVRRMIMSGLGIGVLPVAAVENDIVAGSLHALPILEGMIGADVYLVSNPNIELRPVERLYLSIVDELLVLERPACPPPRAVPQARSARSTTA